MTDFMHRLAAAGIAAATLLAAADAAAGPRNDTLYVADHQSNAKINPGVKRGIYIGSARDGTVRAFIPGLGAEIDASSVGEGVAADAAGNVYMSETGGMTVRKFLRK